jgi:hypothetical protein
MTKVGWYAIGKSTTLESNKSHAPKSWRRSAAAVVSGRLPTKMSIVNSLSFGSQTIDYHSSTASIRRGQMRLPSAP